LHSGGVGGVVLGQAGGISGGFDVASEYGEVHGSLTLGDDGPCFHDWEVVKGAAFCGVSC
jgi:hypothetical protein